MNYCAHINITNANDNAVLVMRNYLLEATIYEIINILN